MNRSTRQQLAQHTLELLEAGHYRLPDGSIVDFSSALERCLRDTRLYSPEQLEALAAGLRGTHPEAPPGVIDVRNQSTLQGIDELLALQSGPVLALNFASAKNPGGGFLGGSQPQEESLARSSGLYPSLLRAGSFYAQHRGSGTLLYSAAAILSPACPLLRDDAGRLRERLQLASFITCAAPNAGAIATQRPAELPRIPAVLRQRCEYVLALAAALGYPNLVLGAWGCGVFRNDPAMVAEAFAGLLLEQGWARRFARVRFAVLDGSAGQATFEVFRQRLAPAGGALPDLRR